MELAYTAEQEDLRREIRAYFRDLMTPAVEAEVALGETGGPACLEAVRKMGHDGWLTLGWPEEYGGRGPPTSSSSSSSTSRGGSARRSRSSRSTPWAARSWSTAPTSRSSSSCPKISAGELHFSIGYTEPSAGTDLASLTTRADRDGDQWVINGQKIYTSLASYADYIWLAARTDQEASKHKGISIFLVPTTDPGFSYSKISTMVNASTYNTFYDDVRVGDDAIVYGLNRGWDLIINQLNYERVSLGPPGMVERIFEEVLAWAQTTKRPDGTRVADQQWVQLNLARVHAKLEVAKLLNWKVAAQGGTNPADSSATKVFATEFYTEAYRLLMEILGPAAYLNRDHPARCWPAAWSGRSRGA